MWIGRVLNQDLERNSADQIGRSNGDVLPDRRILTSASGGDCGLGSAIQRGVQVLAAGGRTQNGVGGVEFLSSFHGAGIAGIQVRMELACEPAVGGLDLVGSAIALQAEHVVGIGTGHGVSEPGWAIGSDSIVEPRIARIAADKRERQGLSAQARRRGILELGSRKWTRQGGDEYIPAMKTLGLALALATVIPARAMVFTFDSGSQGWTGADNDGQSPFGTGGIALTVDHQSTGGNPGGHISITDPSNLDFYFVAPSSVLGNQSSAYGTSLSWDLKVSGNTYDPVPDVVLRGAGLELVLDVGPAPTPDLWSGYSVVLNETGGWRKGTLSGATPSASEFQAVLADLTGLRIRGEYFAGGLGSEVGSLDNVNFAAVPEPAEMFGWAAGLCFAGALWYRRTNGRKLRAES